MSKWDLEEISKALIFVAIISGCIIAVFPITSCVKQQSEYAKEQNDSNNKVFLACSARPNCHLTQTVGWALGN